MVIEPQAVSATDERDVVRAKGVQELRLSLSETAFGLRRVVAVQMRWRLGEYVPVRLRACGERVVGERKLLGSESGGVRWRRVTALAGLPRGTVDVHGAR